MMAKSFRELARRKLRCSERPDFPSFNRRNTNTGDDQRAYWSRTLFARADQKHRTGPVNIQYLWVAGALNDIGERRKLSIQRRERFADLPRKQRQFEQRDWEEIGTLLDWTVKESPTGGFVRRQLRGKLRWPVVLLF